MSHLLSVFLLGAIVMCFVFIWSGRNLTPSLLPLNLNQPYLDIVFINRHAVYANKWRMRWWSDGGNYFVSSSTMKTTLSGVILLSIVQCMVGMMHGENIRAAPLAPGGRFDVHGWLILPQEQMQDESNSSYGIRAWFSHHVPEFWKDSPHNFQIILDGVLLPETSVPGTAPLPLSLPMPPTQELEIYEYSFTPPSPFSLNDLITGKIQQLRGVYYNGSFDTPYERIPQSLALLQIESLTTVVYLKESEANAYPSLRYYSYPRNTRKSAMSSRSKHFYFAHAIHAQPDFDHVVHGTIDQCTSTDDLNQAMQLLYTPGVAVEVPGVPNTLEYKLKTDQVVPIHLVSSEVQLTCTLTVLESIHCMIGPDFMSNC